MPASHTPLRDPLYHAGVVDQPLIGNRILGDTVWAYHAKAFSPTKSHTPWISLSGMATRSSYLTPIYLRCPRKASRFAVSRSQRDAQTGVGLLLFRETTVAVGMTDPRHPLHRSLREGLPHTAHASGYTAKTRQSIGKL